MKDKLIYLGSPYSHANPDVILRRYNQISYIAGQLITDGYLIYAPISQSHPIAKQGFADTWQMWQRLDMEMLRRCDVLWIAKMQGWDISVGLAAEIEEAKRLGLEIGEVPEQYMRV